MARLVDAQQPMVEHAARTIARYGCPYEDLLQQGQLGLLHAVRTFDPQRGVRFWTYARWWVRAYIRRYVSRNRRIVPLASNRSYRKVATNLHKVEQRIGPDGEATHVADALSVSEEVVSRVRTALRSGDISLDGPRCPMTPTSEHPTPEDEVEARLAAVQRHDVLRRALAGLDEREREVIERRYLDEPGETLASLGRRLGVSRERARQLSERALRKLRCKLDEAEGSPEAA